MILSTDAAESHPRIDLLGVPVSSVTMPRALDLIERWVGGPTGRYICVADVHSIMRTDADADHLAVMKGADMITPDGTPLVWAARLKGRKDIARVCGPDLMLEAFMRSSHTGWRHFLVGGAEGVPEELAKRLCERFPGIRIVGAYSPPFRPTTSAEDEELLKRIRQSEADIVWVGLGCPKQERWMAERAERLPGTVLIGVGAAFDFHSGRIRRAPAWMRRSGLEWLHRLASEPARLWRRYLILGPKFIARIAAEQVELLGARAR